MLRIPTVSAFDHSFKTLCSVDVKAVNLSSKSICPGFLTVDNVGSPRLMCNVVMDKITQLGPVSWLLRWDSSLGPGCPKFKDDSLFGIHGRSTCTQSQANSILYSNYKVDLVNPSRTDGVF